MIQKLLIPLFTIIWWHRLLDEDYAGRGFKRSQVVKVKGWRTAIIDHKWGGGRSTDTFMIKFLKWYI